MKNSTIMLIIFNILLFGCSSYKKEEKEILKEIKAIVNYGIRIGIENTTKDPTSTAKVLLKRLKETKKYVQKVESGRVKFDAEKMLSITKEAMSIVKNIKNDFKIELSGDVAFELGEFDVKYLLEDGREILNQFVDKIINIQVKEYIQKFPNEKMYIVITTVGYADGVAPGARLKRNIDKYIAKPLTKNNIRVRRILNKELSKRRAITINKYLRDKIREKLLYYNMNSNIILDEPVIEGKGEEYPFYNVTPPYKKEDSRRRICKIYSNILIK